jgi:hypothetical protein
MFRAFACFLIDAGCGQTLRSPSVRIVVQPFRAAGAGRKARTTMAIDPTKFTHTNRRMTTDSQLARKLVFW